MFASTRAESRWRSSGSPYCEHPHFWRDSGPAGIDDVDEYCESCGITRYRGSTEVPAPRGKRA